MTKAIISEMEERKDYLNDAPIESLYIGGGTPSTLSLDQIDSIFNAIYKHFGIANNAEVTFEANPDDVTQELLNHLKTTPVNRFSMGVQSFFDEDLQWMNRAHSAADALSSIQMIQDKGFDAISIDLIYGMPTLSEQHWQFNLQQAIDLQLEHISSYCLTIEPRTSLHHQVMHKQAPALDEDQAAKQFDQLVSTLSNVGFEQYEISNFALNQKYALHNTNYWKNKPYLGLGPSAHSFNKTSRRWNISSNQQYMKAIDERKRYWEEEVLTLENRMNEYIMTSLRTQWGFDSMWFIEQFGQHWFAKLERQLEIKTSKGVLLVEKGKYRIAPHARFLADGIAADLFI